ncbi:MAG: D-alanine--poly(phosphoribitol) ligase subunit DltC [Clostridia bacterium]|nr:D-alanine--poly(phosphoribitol) ligase subunit DltC [Clostridia bacterium]MDO5302284.1 D-alanine--poly(phosphoribitol) ligase subunit DltC [Clostridia bacterium]
MEEKVLEEKVLDILEEICDDDIVRTDRDINLLDEGLMDSLDFTELIIMLEDQLGVIISPSEYTREESDTPAKIIEIVRSKA